MFGVKGWLKVQSYTEPRDNIVEFPVWTLRQTRRRPRDSRWRKVEATAATWSPNCAASTTAIERASWIGAEIVVEREQLPAAASPASTTGPISRGSRFGRSAGEALGVVDHLLATGANDVLVLGRRARAMIPFVVGDVSSSRSIWRRA